MTYQGLEVGYDIPALPGMAVEDIQTPCLVLDLDALERNIRAMRDFLQTSGMRHRAHAKMHKSVEVAKLHIALGGAVGVCCQKVSEAEVFVRGGVRDVLVSNQVRGALKCERLARLPLLGAEVSVCVDDAANVLELSAAAQKHGTTLTCLVEIDCGGARCGVVSAREAVELANAIRCAPGLTFGGIQAYQGAMQHIRDYEERHEAFAVSAAFTAEVVAALISSGIEVPIVTGGGTGSYDMEAFSGIWTELQCGSYAFMDADYGRVLDSQGRRLDAAEWQNALFLLTSIMSTAGPDRAVCDAGLKVQSMDSGLPEVWGRNDVRYIACSDEHGTIDDPSNVLKVGDRLRLVAGHCDPTCNLHDWYVGVRGERVETLWPVSARGKAF